MSDPTGWDAALPALAGLLSAAGAAKVARPADTARALRAAGLHLGPDAGEWLVRAGALVEVVVGGWVLLAGGRWGAAAVAASYAGFAGFVVWALARGLALSSCGCFGRPDTPPTVAHALVCTAAAVWAGGAAIAGHPGSLPRYLSGAGIGRGAVFVVLSGLAGYAAYLVMSSAAGVAAARRSLRPGGGTG